MSGQSIDRRLQESMEEHAQIADACLARNWELAASAMLQHLEFSKQSALTTILRFRSDTDII